jgi:hypothetical protein
MLFTPFSFFLSAVNKKPVPQDRDGFTAVPPLLTRAWFPWFTHCEVTVQPDWLTHRSAKQLQGGFPASMALKKLPAFGFFSLERLLAVLFLFTAFQQRFL